jgi:triosephosphate isomerase
MHKGPSDARRLALEVRNGRLGSRDGVEVALVPPFVSLAAVAEIVRGTDIRLGAQNVFWEEQGAWTGEIAPDMLRDAGCTHVLIGHSERRTHFGETDATVAKRLRAALDAGLHAIVCIGETLQEREAGATERVVTTQLQGGLGALQTGDWAQVTLAYEPVWAIGTGRNATPAQAQEVHARIRAWIATQAGSPTAESLRILYGGSVKADNAADLLSQPDLDGALVGGASLEGEAFLRIVAGARPRA